MVKLLPKRKYRLTLFMLAMIIPGLIISLLAFLSISHQEKDREIKIEVKYTAALQHLCQEIERETEAAVQETFRHLADRKDQLIDHTSLEQVLKDLLLANPVARYPFIINAASEYIFPFSKKSTLPPFRTSFPRAPTQKTEALFREGERLEFEEREIKAALKKYLQSLSSMGEKEKLQISPTIFNALARCYFKWGKYPQAISYYRDIIVHYSRVSPADKDFSLYFPVLRQMALAYQRMGQTEKTVDLYLQLYDEILQYEASNPAESFAFLKNEALSHLNQYLQTQKGLKKETTASQISRIESTERFRELQTPDIALRWRYYEYEDIYSQTPGADQKNQDIFRFMKIREFYLYTDEKTQFYRAVKQLKTWKNPNIKGTSDGEPGVRQTRLRVAGQTCEVMYKWIPLQTLPLPAAGKGFFGGFMLSPGFFDSDRVREMLRKPVGDPDLRILVTGGHPRGNSSAQDEDYPYTLLSVSFETYFPGKGLALVSGKDHFFNRQAREEIRLNYLLMSAFILMLMLGIYLFYKYFSREAQLVRLKSEFTDSASHTLKTPLTRIRMLAEKLQLGWVSSEAKKQDYLRAILTETDRMNEMITNMLDFSKIEAGRKQYRFQQHSLAAIVRDTLESYESYARNLGFQMEVEVDEEIPPFPLDAEAIRLVLVNLLQNAIKYSHRVKSIGVRLSREEGNAVLEIRDRGIGIAEGDWEKLFQRFYRVPDSWSQAVEGSGLGLFLVKHAVEAHRGTVSVTSQPGQGSRFTVVLPLNHRSQGKTHE